jgi:subtilisin family serine protease
MHQRTRTLAGILSIALAVSANAAAPSKGAPSNSKQASTSSTAHKLGAQLSVLAKASALRGQRGDSARAVASKLPVLRASSGYVAISAYADDPQALRAQLVAKGLQGASVHGVAVTGRAPIAALADMATSQGLKFMRPSLAMTRRGLTTTQGDRSMRTDLARRQFGVNGRGIKVGVLSDSYDCAPGAFEEGARFTRAAEDIANGDLPRNVTVLKDLSATPTFDCSDEGRAMMQLIHDVAPGSPQAFYTAFESQEDFAAGIRALAANGAQVIVDDVIYFAEPMFEDGIIAQAVDDVYKDGVAFFSAAGNDARLSYASGFRLSNVVGLNGRLHDFDPGRGIDALQRVVATPGSVTLLSLQWDEPTFSANGKKGSRSDIDAVFYDMDGNPIEECSPDPAQVICQFPGLDFNVDGDPIELPVLINFGETDLEAQLGVELFEGPTPNYLKYVWFDLDAGSFAVEEFDTASSTTYGHTNAAGAESVGAAFWYQTAAWGSPFRPECIPACLNSYSSAGGTPVFFGKNGNRLPFPSIRIKPGVTGPDAGNTSFFFFDLGFEVPGTAEPDGFPNFFGTSAAAPHVAAIAALMLDLRERDIAAGKRFLGPRKLSPEFMYWVLRLTADDMRLRNFGGAIGPQPFDSGNGPGGLGFDFDSGFGFVNAQRALTAIKGF